MFVFCTTVAAINYQFSEDIHDVQILGKRDELLIGTCRRKVWLTSSTSLKVFGWSLTSRVIKSWSEETTKWKNNCSCSAVLQFLYLCCIYVQYSKSITCSLWALGSSAFFWRSTWRSHEELGCPPWRHLSISSRPLEKCWSKGFSLSRVRLQAQSLASSRCDRDVVFLGIYNWSAFCRKGTSLTLHQLQNVFGYCLVGGGFCYFTL